ncbi:hypothetical protein BMA10229_A3355 [Burkholderia mallei NCTC 10229]|uniref:Uncharacterized protein n=1 Tax=Burkholderia mallei (strain NCTC 10229) TaxID=412022 RepID=A2SBG9_BURM9|nr:hypothetical protein BMA10229_A3355 [Burkholderia mallei NCTC 10229]
MTTASFGRLPGRGASSSAMLFRELRRRCRTMVWLGPCLRASARCAAPR